MSRILSVVWVQILMLVSTALFADVISLKDGTLLEGELVGRDKGVPA